MSAWKVVRVGVFSLLSLVVLFLTVLAVALWLGVTVNLNALRASIANAATEAIGREFRIDGDISVEASLWPTLQVDQVRLANQPGFSDTPLANIDTVFLQLGVMPLLRGQLHVQRFSAQGVVLNLESDKEGDGNWHLAAREQAAKDSSATGAKDTEASERDVGFELETFELKDTSLRYVDQAIGKEVSFKLDQLVGRAGATTPLEMKVVGLLQDVSIDFALKGPALDSIRRPDAVSEIAVEGDVAGTEIDAVAQLSFVKDEPRLSFGLNLGATNIGAVLEWFGFTEGLQASSGALSLDIVLLGDTLEDIAKNTELAVSFGGGSWEMRGPDKEEIGIIKVDQGAINVRPSEALTVELQGDLGKIPVKLAFAGAQLIEYVNPKHALPHSIELSLPDTSVKLTGNLDVPLGQKTFDMTLELEGQNLTTFNEQLDLDLPPLGPYHVSGHYKRKADGYALQDLRVEVGESQLAGSLDFTQSAERPVLKVNLHATSLQLDDFDLQGWSPENGASNRIKQIPNTENNATEDSAESSKKFTGDQVRALMSAEALNSVNGRVELRVDQVLSGQDNLGAGHLIVAVKEGKLEISPLHLAVPGGEVDLNFSFQPTPSGTVLFLDTLVDRFDYGILARRLDPDTKMGGKISLDVTLDATANSTHEILEKGRGQFDFALLPDQFDAGVFDLWAVNLLSAVSAKVDEEPDSVVNCFLARFQLADGVMDDQIIFMDTSRMSVAGKAKVDFNKGTLDVYAKPKAKKPEFFSVPVPVNVSGTFDEWRLRIGAVRSAWAGVSFVTSPLHVPLRRLVRGRGKLDGEEACQQAWEESEALIKAQQSPTNNARE